MKNLAKSLLLCICAVLLILLLVLFTQKMSYPPLPAEYAQNINKDNINGKVYRNDSENTEKEIKIRAEDGNEYHIGNPSVLADFLEGDNIEFIEFWLEFAE